MKHKHNPESMSHPVSKMGGWIREIKSRFPEYRNSRGWGKVKKFYNRKRRRILNNRHYDEKI